MPLNNAEKERFNPYSVCHRAGWVVADADNIIKNGYVIVESGKILETGQWNQQTAGVSHVQKVFDHGPGILMPPLVNAHTHLELSASTGKTDAGSGFTDWVKSVIAYKDTFSDQNIIDASLSGINKLVRSGTGIIGEISSSWLSLKPFLDSSLSGVWFQEFIGSLPMDFIEIKKSNPYKILSAAGHALHTTAPELLVGLKELTDKYCFPFSLHLAESEEEFEFLTKGAGGWADLLTERDIDYSNWQCNSRSPVSYADYLGIINKNTLAVHLLFIDKIDLQILADKKVNVCLCPRSNIKLHGRLPDVHRLFDSGINLSLGTDSLASNSTLNMFDEMMFFAQSFPMIDPADIFAMGTINGALALGLEKEFGSLSPGKHSKILYLPVNLLSKKRVIESIVYSDFSENIKWV